MLYWVNQIKSMYKFIIDTDKYAGNFEREMCAYLTGRIGDCEVGDDFAEIFKKEVGDKASFENVLLVSDEGCYRPCEIEPTLGWFNTGMGNSYRESEEDEEKILKDYALSVENYEAPLIKSKEAIKLSLLEGKKVSNWTVEACDREIKGHLQKISNAQNTKTYSKYPCYNSVAIFFDNKPTTEQISLMKDRANNFSAAKRNSGDYSWDKEFALEISGFRLIKVTKKQEEESV